MIENAWVQIHLPSSSSNTTEKNNADPTDFRKRAYPHLHILSPEAIRLTVPVEHVGVHSGSQHPSNERDPGQHFDVFQWNPFASSSRQNQGSYVSRTTGPGRLGGVRRAVQLSVIPHEAPFPGSHGASKCSGRC